MYVRERGRKGNGKGRELKEENDVKKGRGREREGKKKEC